MSSTINIGHTDDKSHMLYWLDILINGVNPKNKVGENGENGKTNGLNGIKNGINGLNGAFHSENINEYIKNGFQKCHESTKFPYLRRLMTHKCADGILSILEESNDDFSKIRDHVGITLLHLAAENNMLSVVTKLIAIGVDVNIKTNKGGTPLHFAVRKNDVDCVKLLLRHCANPTVKDRFEYTPMDYAKAVEGVECLKVLEKFIHDNELTRRGIYRGLSVEETQIHRENDVEKWNTLSIDS